MVSFFVIALVIPNLILISTNPDDITFVEPSEPKLIISSSQAATRAISNQPSQPRGVGTLGFTENSTGLPASGDYNFVAYSDINNDNEIDIAFGGEDWDVQNTVGIYAYTGNGGDSWSAASTGLWTGNSWGGLAMGDADGDGYIELYATDEDWGTDNNSGVKVWEYRNGAWTDSSVHVSSPDPSGRPCNVILTNVTGDAKLDLVVYRLSGVKYFENQGGNPITWQERSSGLPTSNWYTTGAVEDMNKDGLKDIVCCRNDAEYLYLQSTSGNLWQQPSGGISIPGYMTGVAIADVNVDSHNDIIFGTSTPSNGWGIKVLLGDSGGVTGTSFNWVNGNTGLPTIDRYGQIQVVDIDLDGDLDIIGPCATNSNGMEIYLGNGTESPGNNIGWTQATNVNLTTSGNWYSANCVDINSDGSLDILGASWGDGIKVWLNNLSLDMTPPAPVTDLTITEVTTNSIAVNWSAPADNGTDASSGPVQEYDIRYGSTQITTANWASAIKCTGEPTPGLPGTTQEFNLTGLSPGARYYIGLKSADEQPNWSLLSNIVSSTTLGEIDTTLPGQITDLKTANVTHNSVNITWSAPADNGTDITSGPVIGYEIRYSSAEITNVTWQFATISTNQITPSMPGAKEEYEVTGLHPETNYYFAVKARDERPNWGWISNSPNATTLSEPDITPPGAITDLKAQDPTETTIDLTWTASGDDGLVGTATYYDIRYSTATITDLTWPSASQCSNEPVAQSAGNAELFQITGLTPDTTYYFAIKVGDENPLWSGLSNIASGKTLAELDSISPARIDDLVVTETTQTTITLEWSAPGDDGSVGTASAYDIRYASIEINDATWADAISISDPPIPKQPGELETFIVTGLEPDTTYYFAIKVADEVPNWSPVSNSPYGITLKLIEPELTIIFTPEEISIESQATIELDIKVLSKLQLEQISEASIELSTDHTNLKITPALGQTNQEGVLTVYLTAPYVEHTLEIPLYINISKLGYRSNNSQIMVTVQPQDQQKGEFNLLITDERITLSKDEIIAGDIITIYANITNSGIYESTGFIVTFFVDHKQSGSYEQVTGLQKDEYLNVEYFWVAVEGSHEIQVELTPFDYEFETDKMDNNAVKNITVIEQAKSNNEDKDESQNWTLIYFGLLIIVIIILMVIIFVVGAFRNRSQEATDTREDLVGENLQETPEDIEQQEEPTTSDEDGIEPEPQPESGTIDSQEAPSSEQVREEDGLNPESEAEPISGTEEHTPRTDESVSQSKDDDI